jgi:aminobenzoyl-glutamate utilization protein B
VPAASILDLLTKPELLQRSRTEFAAQLRQSPYLAVLPPAEPPLDLNKATMDRYRPQMRKFHLGEQPRLF